HILNLPPFPTRRSSDLKSSSLPIGESRGNVWIKFSPTLVSSLSSVRLSHRVFICGRWKFVVAILSSFASCARVSQNHLLILLLLDRKSTRLNSSHVAIS